MTVVVVRKGIPPEDYIYSATCRNCGSELEWKREDAARYHSGDQRDPVPFTQINCPVCQHMVTGYRPPAVPETMPKWYTER